MSKLAYELQAKTLEFVLFDQLIQIHTKQFKGDTYMISESEVLIHVDYVHCIVLVLLS